MQAFIDVESKITDTEGNCEKIVLRTEGKFANKEDTFYIAYDENDTENIGTSRMTIKATADKISLTRSGFMPNNLYVEKGKRHLCHYNTEFGQILIGISAISIQSDLTPKGGHLRFVYEIDINSDKCSKNEIDIKVREAI